MLRAPEHPNDESLLSAIFIDADMDAHDAAKDFLEMVGLPNPQVGEFQRAHNVHRIYMPNGFSISFVHRHVSPLAWLGNRLFGWGKENISPVFDARKIVHEQVLQPLLQVDLSPKCCLEIVPGCPRAEADYDGMRRLKGTFLKDKIDFYMRMPEFLGRLPGEEPLEVVTNRRALKPMKGYEASTASLQDKIYGGLRSEFSNAFERASAATFQKLFADCRANVDLRDGDPEKILYAHWKSSGRKLYPSERQMEIGQAAARFEQRLART